jgi:hypothetical protein
MTDMTDGSALVGLFFHSKDETSKIKGQGYVDARIGADLYLVTTFSWFDGSDHNKLLIPLEEMRSWTFYATADAMREAYRRTMPPKDAAWSRRAEEMWGRL